MGKIFIRPQQLQLTWPACVVLFKAADKRNFDLHRATECFNNTYLEAALWQSFSHTLAHIRVERVDIIMLLRCASWYTVGRDSFSGLLYAEDPLASSTTRNGAAHCARVKVSKTTKPASRLWSRRSSRI